MGKSLKSKKRNMRICYECPIMANQPHRYFPYQKGIVEFAKTQDKLKVNIVLCQLEKTGINGNNIE